MKRAGVRDPRARETAVRAAFGLVAIALLGVGLGRLVTGPLAHVVARDLDAPARRFSVAHGGPPWHRLLSDVSDLGTATVTGVLAVVGGALVAVRRRAPVLVAQAVAAFAGAALLTVTVKIGVHRYPASGVVPDLTSGTFPSGHALFAATVYGTFAVFVARSAARVVVRVTGAAAFVVLALLVGWTRVYLLDHYLSDVVGSVVLGALWVAVVATAADHISRAHGDEHIL
ncbi:MAG TPA: phosphatase PAP2 family protein [Acidimicrobiia bacterium]|nr:phosphatase PAP2 family protein [Acidimicrobiia bacterium]